MEDKQDNIMNNEEEEEGLSLEKIVIALENIESQNLSEDEGIQNWLRQITSIEFKLIDSFINLFLDSINDHQLVTTVFKVLLKLNYYQKEIVQPQLQENPQLFKSLIDYLSKTEKIKLTGEPFILLLNVCQKNEFKNVIFK